MSAMPGLFRRWAIKTALCKIPFFYNLSIIFNILETATGVDRPAGGGEGYGWHFGSRISSSAAGLPPGYEERQVYLYCKGEKLAVTILVKSNTEEDETILVSEAYASPDKRKLLQVTEPSAGKYALELDDGYLRE